MPLSFVFVVLLTATEGVTPPGGDMIQIRGLRKVYPSRLSEAPKIALHDLWLGVREGELVGYLGLNGAGL